MELKLKETKDDIISLINESGLPLSLLSYVLRDLLNEVDALRAQQLQQEILAQNENIESTDLETL